MDMVVKQLYYTKRIPYFKIIGIEHTLCNACENKYGMRMCAGYLEQKSLNSIK